MNDKKQTPSFILTGDPGSFAEHTLVQRMPRIIDQVISDNQPAYAIEKGLLEIKRELKEGEIKNPFEGGFDKSVFEDSEIEAWNKKIKAYEGSSWRSVPWYFAEALFYLKILFAFHYFNNDSEFWLKDPFQKAKDTELFSEQGGLQIARCILDFTSKIDSWERRIMVLIYCSLWGNRIDLSNIKIANGAGNRILKNQEDNLMINHTKKLIKRLLESKRVDVVADNSGTELICDLILTQNLLRFSKDLIVHIHLKKYPMFVSDAMLKDVEHTLDALATYRYGKTRALGMELRLLVDEKRLFFHDHFFWNSPLHFCDFPRDLTSEFSKTDIVIFKGDVNYRRLLSDRRWPPWSNMEDITRYFPTTFAVLRTMKSEIGVDLTGDMVDHLCARDPDWMVNGERGIIRLVEK